MHYITQKPHDNYITIDLLIDSKAISILVYSTFNS